MPWTEPIIGRLPVVAIRESSQDRGPNRDRIGQENALNARIESMELRLKIDILEEIKRYNGKLLLHSESQDAQLVTHWQTIVALIVGGLIAAHLAAKLAGKLPKKTAFFLLGVLVIFWSIKILIDIVR